MTDWHWYASLNGEEFTVGPEPSREAVIQSATCDFDGDSFHIVEARKGSMAAFLPSGERIIEWMMECADDNDAFGESDYCELQGPTAAAEADLEIMLRLWFERHVEIFPTPWTFAETRNAEWIARTSREE